MSLYQPTTDALTKSKILESRQRLAASKMAVLNELEVLSQIDPEFSANGSLDGSNKAIAKALERSNWGNVPVGVKAIIHSAIAALCADSGQGPSFQDRAEPWMLECFGPAISADTVERNDRFLEESVELVQSCGMTRSVAHQIVDYGFDKAVGEKHQEVGGVMVTLAALCLANDLDMHDCGEIELSRIWGKVKEIGARQAEKPKFEPLPKNLET